MIIDFHCHYDEGNIGKFVEEARRLKMKVCLSGLGPHYKEVGNEEVEKAFKKYPDTIIGMGFIRLGCDGPDTVENLYNRGFKTLGELVNPAKDYDDEEFFPIYERAEILGMPILFHTGIVGYRDNDRYYDVSSKRMHPITLDAIARRFPKLNMVAAHMGGVFRPVTAELVRQLPNLYFDLAGNASWYYTPAEKYKELLDRPYWCGYDKMVFGVDSYVSKPEMLKIGKDAYEKLLKKLGVNEETKRKIFGETVKGFLK